MMVLTRKGLITAAMVLLTVVALPSRANLAQVCPEAAKELETAQYHQRNWIKHLDTMAKIDGKKNDNIGRAIDELREISFQDVLTDAATDAAFEASQTVIQKFGKRCIKVGAKLIGKANAIVGVLQTALSLSNIAPGVMDALGLNSQQQENYRNAQSAGAFEASQMNRAMKRYLAALEKCKCEQASATPPTIGKDDGKNEPSKGTQGGTHGRH